MVRSFVRPTVFLKRSLIFLHRWLGVALSVVFTLWFASGIVMMYWTFPGVTRGDRLERALRLDPAQVRVLPLEAAATVGRDAVPAQTRITSFDGRPVYRFGGGDRERDAGEAMVFADDGSLPPAVDDTTIDRAASRWAGRPLEEGKRESIEETDQWTVAGGLRDMRPLLKYSWPDGQQVYVNGKTAEVVQYTTASSRFWAYLGAIPHWMYFTPLRKHQPQWFAFVVYSSLVGTIAALIGVIVAVWMYSPRKQYRLAGAQTSIPYRGWKRWHMIIGLIFGATATTWAFSGLLSMGPFPIVDRLTDLTVPAPLAREGAGGRTGRRGAGSNVVENALRGGPGGPLMSAYAGRSPSEAIAAVPDFDVRELEYTSFAGKPLYLATNARGETRLIPIDGAPMTGLRPEDMMRVVRGAIGPNLAELRIMEEYDAYYLDRRGEKPLPVIYARLRDAVDSRYYIDPATAKVAGQYSARGWVNRWLYHGLHSLDFPWLYAYRPLWDIVVITLMLGGTGLCVTSLVMTYRVLARKVAALARLRITQPNEDLAL